MLDAESQLWALFLSAFISSTIAPGGSEAVLGWLATSTAIPGSFLLVSATVGNTLGAFTTLLLGIFARKGWKRAQIPERRRNMAMDRVQQWGISALLFSWLPVVGDALCFAAGWLRLPLFSSMLAIMFGKLCRYAVVLYMFQ